MTVADLIAVLQDIHSGVLPVLMAFGLYGLFAIERRVLRLEIVLREFVEAVSKPQRIRKE